MKQNFTKLLFISVILTFFLASCVTTKEHDALLDRFNKCNDENSTLKENNRKLSIANTERDAELKNLKSRLKTLEQSFDDLKRKNLYIQESYDQLKNTYDLMLKENKNKLSGKDEETRKILTDLQATQERLFKQEDELKKIAEELAEKKLAIQEKEKRLNELEYILFKKDSVVNALKNTVSDALLGFVNEGLSVDIRNGKVYVSLEEKLLFASGKYDVGTKGAEALKKLAKVLEDDPEINILIEGHTDNVPYNGSGQIKDNWDLSVMRATAIVKILIKNSKIDPKRLMAAGHSKYIPVDIANTPEARAKNRRTEIILTPKLDELFQILEMN